MQRRLVDHRARPATAGLDVGEHVLLAHAPLAPGPLHLVEVDVVLGRDALDHRRVPAGAGRAARARRLVGGRRPGLGRRRRGRLHGRLAGGRRGLARGRRAVLLGGVRLPGLGVGRQSCEDGADVDRRADLDHDLGHAARRGRRDLGVDLVGRDVDDRLLVLDPVAHLLAPLDDRALGDRDAHLRHDDVDQCRVSTRGAHGRPPSRDRRSAATPARAGARTGSGHRAWPRGGRGRRGPRSPSRR